MPGPCSPATTGAAGPPALLPRCGRSGARAWSRSTAISSRTSRRQDANPAIDRVGPLVSVLFPDGARPRRAGGRPARDCSRALDAAIRRPGISTKRRSIAHGGAFDNPDYVDVVIHSYRHRLGLATGYPPYEEIETEARGSSRRSPCRPSRWMAMPTASILQPTADRPPAKFRRPRTTAWFAGAGHNLPQEAPSEFADAVMDLMKAG